MLTRRLIHEFPAWKRSHAHYAVLRPVLIRRGVDLPLLLITAGVIGGLIGFGVVGLFIGPVILAVTYTMLKSWISDDRGAAQ